MPMSGKKLSGRDMVCPYFRREETQSISCESWVKGCTVKLCFRDREGKDRYAALRCKCMEGYGKCLVARAAGKKYE